MPLDFAENEKPKPPVEFFVTNTKARPLDLEGEVLPELIRLCGDVKSGRITVEMVEAYLDKNVLIFDRALLKSLFAEADFRNEGSLNAKALKAALSARYPKRQLHREWRDLVALLMRVPELVLADDIKQTKLFDGTFNKESVWDSPPKELPQPPKRRKPKKKPVTSTQGGASSSQQGGSNTVTTLTAEGVKSTVEPGGQAKINALGMNESRSTFAATKEFEKLQRSQELEAAFRTISNSAAGPTDLTETSVMGSSKQSVRAWSSVLAPTTISIPSSALSTLRASVRSTMARKPAFVTSHPPLTAAETDLKKTLGQPMDISVALNRVEPVRPTKIMPQADYVQWGDLAKCRTAPTAWFNEHPAAPAPPAEHRWC